MAEPAVTEVNDEDPELVRGLLVPSRSIDEEEDPVSIPNTDGESSQQKILVIEDGLVPVDTTTAIEIHTTPNEDGELESSDDDEEEEGLLEDSPSPPRLHSSNRIPKVSGKRRALVTPTLPCQSSTRCYCCSSPERVGNMRIVFPSCFTRHGWGIMGPHWFGPPIVLVILGVGAHYFTRQAWDQVGPISAALCLLWTACTVYYLVKTAYSDPGLVQLRANPSGPPPPPPSPRHRWCDACSNYQPPSGAHCLDCQVCIVGYDHHCLWMGTCIGRGNMKPFQRFNLSWFTFLLYGIAWVLILGPYFAHSSTEPIPAGNATIPVATIAPSIVSIDNATTIPSRSGTAAPAMPNSTTSSANSTTTNQSLESGNASITADYNSSNAVLLAPVQASPGKESNAPTFNLTLRTTNATNGVQQPDTSNVTEQPSSAPAQERMLD
jgi:DHHC palmitoyltransferase